jgi:DHA2 family multidrug resistance protein
MRGCGLIICFATLSTVALGTLPPSKIQSGSGLFNLTRNLGGAVGLAILSTLTDYFNVFHRTQLGEAMNVGDPMFQERLASNVARMTAMNVANPDQAALAQMMATLNREAAVMSFNNLFMVVALCMGLSMLVLPFVRRPAANADVSAAH